MQKPKLTIEFCLSSTFPPFPDGLAIIRRILIRIDVKLDGISLFILLLVLIDTVLLLFIDILIITLEKLLPLLFLQSLYLFIICLEDVAKVIFDHVSAFRSDVESIASAIGNLELGVEPWILDNWFVVFVDVLLVILVPFFYQRR